LSLLEVGTWLGKSQAKFEVEKLLRGTPDDALDAALMRPVR